MTVRIHGTILRWVIPWVALAITATGGSGEPPTLPAWFRAQDPGRALPARPREWMPHGSRVAPAQAPGPATGVHRQGPIRQLGWGGVRGLNSVAAVESFLRAGGVGVALRVRVTRDGVAVGLGGKSLDGGAGGDGAVGAHRWEEGLTGRNGDPVALLTELLGAVRFYGGEVFLDVADSPPGAVAGAVLRSGIAPESVAVQVLRVPALARYRELLPRCRFFLRSPVPAHEIPPAAAGGLACAGFDGISLPLTAGHPMPHYSWVQETVRRGLEVQVCSPATPSEVQTLSGLGVASVVVEETCAPVREWRGPLQVGWGGVAQRNTLAAVHEAIDRGADGVEIDIRASKDGVAIAIHDATLDRETYATGEVGAMTWDQLSRVRLRAGGTIDRLDEMLAAAVHASAIVFLDVRDVPASVVEKAMTASNFPPAHLRILAFDDTIAHTYGTTFPAAELYRKEYRNPSAWHGTLLDEIARAGYHGVALPVWTEMPDAAFINRVKARGLRTFVFLVHTEPKAKSLAAAGIDYLVNSRQFYDSL